MKKVKSLLLVAIAALVIFPFINGCKKGANDPFITIKSRDARITAKWKLTKVEGTVATTIGATLYTTTCSFDGATYTTSTTPGTSTTKSTGTFEMTISEDGVVDYSETCTPDGGTAVTVTGKGTWQWVDSDKDKAFLYLVISNMNYFSSNLYYIDELKSKELILKYVSEETDDGDVNNINKTYTFTKQ